MQSYLWSFRQYISLSPRTKMLHTAQYSTMIHLFYFISKSFEMGIAICCDMTLSLTLVICSMCGQDIMKQIMRYFVL